MSRELRSLVVLSRRQGSEVKRRSYVVCPMSLTSSCVSRRFVVRFARRGLFPVGGGGYKNLICFNRNRDRKPLNTIVPHDPAGAPGLRRSRRRAATASPRAPRGRALRARPAAAAAHTPPGGSLITRHYRAPAQSSQTALVPLQTGPGPVVARTREAKPILEPTH